MIEIRSFVDAAVLMRVRAETMASANLQGAVLRRASLQGANLQDAWLVCAGLSGADMRGANLWQALLSSCRYDVRTSWPWGFRPKRRGCVLVADGSELVSAAALGRRAEIDPN
jgi:hypothetical protein